MKSYLIVLDSDVPVTNDKHTILEYAKRHAGMRSEILEFANEQGIDLKINTATPQAYLISEMNPSDVKIVSSFPSVKEILPNDSFADELI